LGNKKEIQSFRDLKLSESILKVLDEVGYETPTPIQREIIPHVLNGVDVLGQAQTGTGKTAAFALPLLTKIQLNKIVPQVLVLTPTRELAIQIAEAFQKYASHMKKFHVSPIYGGQSYTLQLKQLKRGVHVIVGTPGRVMDHIKRKTLVLDNLMTVVLDEGDEMLRMGFIDDVEWILGQTPDDIQIALFSATMPSQIKKIAQNYQKNPIEVKIQVKTATADTIRQRYWIVKEIHKLDALTRILESEKFDGVIVFVRTKTETIELNEKLLARGFASSAINGDIAQKQREKTVEDLKAGKLDILIATDVAARGLDVERISHVINYDIPYDTESYIHRIGRTGRAGRKGEAILFVSNREEKMLGIIQKVTNQKMEELKLPTREDIQEIKLSKFKSKISELIQEGDFGFYSKIVQDLLIEKELTPDELSAALLKILFDKDPTLSPQSKKKESNKQKNLEEDFLPRRERDRDNDRERNRDRERDRDESDEPGMERYRVEIGKSQGLKPGHLVGIIANEAGIDGSEIGRINIFENYTTIDLPEGLPKELLKQLKKVLLFGKPLKIAKAKESNEFRDSGEYDSPKRGFSTPRQKRRKRN
jgi:ATP-dependent RNA helicase DeaD